MSSIICRSTSGLSLNKASKRSCQETEGTASDVDSLSMESSGIEAETEGS